MTVRFRSPFPMFACDDLDACLRFYRDLLGFEPTYRFPEEGTPAFVALTLDGASIGFTSTANPTIHGRSYGERGTARAELCIYTDDVDRAVSWLRGNDVEVLVEPVEQPWGERIAYVTDPAGNGVMLTASPAA